MPDFLSGYGWMILGGLSLTIAVSVASMLGAIVTGLAASLLSLSSNSLLRALIRVYTTVIRGIPELVLLLLVYYGVPTLIQDVSASAGFPLQVNLNPFAAGVMTLAFIYGAFTCEVFRSAYLAVPRGQHEAAAAFGLTPSQRFFSIILPQMLRYALPALGNVWMVLLKATALISIIQLPELMRISDMAARATRQPFTFFLIACLAYLAITLVSMWAQGHAERWANKGVARSGA